ncbi:MAG: serine acetyltransferase [Myxococcota bacterium]
MAAPIEVDPSRPFIDLITPDSHMPDWARETVHGYEPGKMLLKSIRTYAKYSGRSDPIAVACRKWATAQHRLWSVVCGADIPLGTQLGGGLLLPHPQGVVIHGDAIIGANCLIMSQVTIGVTRRGGPPVIGGAVDIGTGAKILGAIKIGDGAQIGANAVVLTDIPAGATAVGIPARISTKSLS